MERDENNLRIGEAIGGDLPAEKHDEPAIVTGEQSNLGNETDSNRPEGNTPADEFEYGLVKSKKDFKFVKPIEELYDEKAFDPLEETDIIEYNEDTVKGKKVKTKRKGCLLALLYTSVLVAVAGAVAVCAVLAFLDITAIGKSYNKQDVTIPPKASTAVIADKLKSAGIINNALTFRLYVKFKNVSGIKYGTHTLNSDMGYGEIIRVLKQSDTSRAIVKVTIPEGKTLQWIDQKLADDKVCDQGEFITACNNGGFKFSFDQQIPKGNKDRLYTYEGYLFPDTYEFYVGSTGKAAAQKILNNFGVKFTKDMTDRAAALGYTVDQVITLASIIQAETGDPQQMKHVSSVFHNRLEKPISDIGGKFLQSDATVFYVTKDVQPVLAKTSIENASAYNTYKTQGLPPGPICNPGIEAINAALYPDNTADYYFVTDSNHKYYYAKTLKQHNRNVKTALSTKSATGTDVYK